MDGHTTAEIQPSTDSSINQQSSSVINSSEHIAARFKAGLQSALKLSATSPVKKARSTVAAAADCSSLMTAGSDDADTDLLGDGDESMAGEMLTEGGGVMITCHDTDYYEDALLQDEPAAKKARLNGNELAKSELLENNCLLERGTVNSKSLTAIQITADNSSKTHLAGASEDHSSSSAPISGREDNSNSSASVSGTESVDDAQLDTSYNFNNQTNCKVPKTHDSLSSVTLDGVTPVSVKSDTSQMNAESAGKCHANSKAVSAVQKSSSDDSVNDQVNSTNDVKRDVQQRLSVTNELMDIKSDNSNSSTNSTSRDVSTEPVRGSTAAGLNEHNEPVTSVHTERASPHVSPTNSDDEDNELHTDELGDSCTGTEISEEEDSRDEEDAPISSASAGRLQKLISQLSDNSGGKRTLKNGGGGVFNDHADDENNDILLEKNVLASFYDRVIRNDVIKEQYHDEMRRRHDELRIKNNMDCKKINKILHEVKAIREKLKLLNMRPQQRSVSTQISSTSNPQNGAMLSPSAAIIKDVGGLKTIKSRVLSQKALDELKQINDIKKQQTVSTSVVTSVNSPSRQLISAAAGLTTTSSSTTVSAPPVSNTVPNSAAVITTAMPINSTQTSSSMSTSSSTSRVFSTTSTSTTSSHRQTKQTSEVIDLTAEERSSPPISSIAVSNRPTAAVRRPPSSTPSTTTSSTATPSAATPSPATPSPATPSPATPKTTKSLPSLAAKTTSHSQTNSNGVKTLDVKAAAQHPQSMPRAGGGVVAPQLHPAPLPPCPLTGRPGPLKKPPSPTLDLCSKRDGIVLQWNMLLTKQHARVISYQIFGYKERPGPITGTEWKKVGDLKALPLPMACTLTQFQTGHTYHFAVRAVDDLGRTGPFGLPKSTKLGHFSK